MSIMDIVRQRRDPLLKTVEEAAGQLPLGLDQPKWSAALNWLQVLAGTLLLAVGGKLTIDNGITVANALGLSTATVGLVFVAVGTSLPELVTSVIAAFRREPDLSVGNVMGSNIFNTLLVLPVGALITPIEVPPRGTLDIVASLLLALALLPIFLIGKHFMGRAAGSLVLAGYLVYLSWRTFT
jgi:cation:H+ antiporter